MSLRSIWPALAGLLLMLARPAASAFAQDAMPGPVQPTASSSLTTAFAALHLSPQQFVTLKDFVGQFGRNANVASVTAADGSNALELRDLQSGMRMGTLTLRRNADGSVWASRLVGNATLDTARPLELPVLASSKNRDELSAALSNSAVGAGDPTTGFTNAPYLASRRIDGVQTDPRFMGTVSQTEGMFFADGSAYITTLRGIVLPGAPASAPPPPLHMASRFLSRIESDGANLVRAHVIDLVIDGHASFLDAQTRLSCTLSSKCGPAWSAFVQSFASGVHVMRRSNVAVQASADLVTQISAQAAQASGTPWPGASPPGETNLPANTPGLPASP